MHVVQVLLPLRDNDGTAFDAALLGSVRHLLMERFGGVTTFVRAPARGLWKEDDGAVVQDDVVIYETMVEDLDQEWWAEYREELRRQFRQEDLVIRAYPCTRL